MAGIAFISKKDKFVTSMNKEIGVPQTFYNLNSKSINIALQRLIREIVKK